MKTHLTRPRPKNFSTSPARMVPRAPTRLFRWRASRDPYRIWVAEIMLQQTRIAAVIPYYQRFLDAFPTSNRSRARREARRPETLVRPRLLQPRAQSASRRERNRRAAQRQISARARRGSRAARHRPLHRRGGAQHRLRRAARRARRQRRARPRAARRHSRRSARAATDGALLRTSRRICSRATRPAIGTRR